jgi:4-alpha-glucanotransferase
MIKDHAAASDAQLRALADRWGISPAYYDIFGNWREMSRESCLAFLTAMGIDDDSQPTDDAARPCVLREGRPLHLPAPAELRLEDGTTLRVEQALPPDLPLGYHDILPADGSAPIRLIKCPAHCHGGEGLRLWGWAVQLYAVRSSHSWGMGDLADLRRLADWSVELGAGAMLVNPLSAATPVLPQEASPYYPSSRRFRNPLYLCVEELAGAGGATAEFARWSAEGRALNQLPRIDRDRVFRAKMSALEWLWARRAEEPDFARYCQSQGEGLHAFAVFCTLAERCGGDWRAWPPMYRRPDTPEVRALAEEQADRVTFHKWLQWLLDRQLAVAAARVPLVHDLPIGVDPRGADAWQWQDVLAPGVSVGAPPDAFNQAGQDWALPPFNPHRLRAANYQPFIETIRAALRHASGLRMDHVMGLFRLFWIPPGQGPTSGTYVRYPADELLAIVALESQRAKAWVAGEDLGTVEPDVRRRLAEDRMLSYRLMWFEDGPPREYPELALAAISTHDLPTVAGLWTGADWAAQQRLGLHPDAAGYQRIRQRLADAAGVRDGATAAEAIVRAYTALARAPSRVLVANLEDALEVEDRPNMPGTIQQWPNWCLALPRPLEDLQAGPLPRAIAAALRR